MVDFRSYYNSRAKKFGRERPLEQVGHTEAGQPISSDQFAALNDDIVNMLNLNSDDVLLDLACGNGAITQYMARRCKAVYGVDFSSEMIASANASNSAANVVYLHTDVFQLTTEHVNGTVFSKVLMYGALQHIKPDELDTLIRSILSLCGEHTTLVFGFIPNLSHKWRFYNTLRKRMQHIYYTLTQRDVMGTWWGKSDIEASFKRHNLQCQFIDITEGQYGHTYRFHAVASRSSQH